MTADYILEIIGRCDELCEFDTAVDFLGKSDRSASVKVNEVQKTKRAYSDGEKLLSTEVELQLRLSADKEKNYGNRRLLEKICAELSSFGRTAPFPQNDSGEIPLSIEISGGAEATTDDTHSAMYVIKFKIYYLKER